MSDKPAITYKQASKVAILLGFKQKPQKWKK
jgi:hypothetical protein